MNPAESYNPTPEPSPGSILAALNAIKRDQAEILSMLRAGQVGLLALQVTSPPFVEEKPKGDDGWIEFSSRGCPVQESEKVDYMIYGSITFLGATASSLSWGYPITHYRPAQEQA